MDLIEVTVGSSIRAAFDSRVLEFFMSFNDSVRIHVKQLTVTVSGPDKNGRRTVKFNNNEPNPNSYYQWSKLDDTAFGEIQPLLDALKVAGVEVATP